MSNRFKEISDDYVRTVWTWMIACGGVVPKPDPDRWAVRDRLGSYYGCYIEINQEESMAIAQKLLDGVEIDWSKMREPDSGMEHRFNGTFTSSQLEVRYFEGVLHLVDGTEVQWAMENVMDQPDLSRFDFGATIRKLTEMAERTMEDAVARLIERCTEETWCFVSKSWS